MKITKVEAIPLRIPDLEMDPAEIPFVAYTLADSPLRRDLVRIDVQVANGVARIPQPPGVGIEFNEEIVTRYRTDR